MNDALQRIDGPHVCRVVHDMASSIALEDPVFEEWARRYGPSHTDHFTSVIKTVQTIDREVGIRNVLEIGAVPGYITSLLNQTGLSVMAADLAPERAASIFCQLGVTCMKVDVETQPLPVPDASVDLVLFCEILEHLRTGQLHALRECTRVLRPGGQIVVSTPQITPLMRWEFLWGTDYQGDIVAEMNKVEAIGHMGHIRLYSRRDVVGMLNAVGLTLIDATAGGKLTRRRGFVPRVFCALAQNAMRAQVHYRATK